MFLLDFDNTSYPFLFMTTINYNNMMNLLTEVRDKKVMLNQEAIIKLQSFSKDPVEILNFVFNKGREQVLQEIINMISTRTNGDDE